MSTDTPIGNRPTSGRVKAAHGQSPGLWENQTYDVELTYPGRPPLLLQGVKGWNNKPEEGMEVHAAGVSSPVVIDWRGDSPVFAIFWSPASTDCEGES